MQPVRILDIGDMQNGFCCPDGNLYIPGAEEIIGPVNDFLGRAEDGVFDHTFVVMDTHFREEYGQSEESGQFPIHCEYGTRDWAPAVDVTGLPALRYLMKNRFDMWAGKQETPVSFTDPGRRAAYDSLFNFTADPRNPREKIPRDDYIRAISPANDPANLDVTLLGVASDYCNRYAMEGWLRRGARVTILSDLTRGIAKETAGVLCEDKYRHFMPGRLRCMGSAEFLRNAF